MPDCAVRTVVINAAIASNSASRELENILPLARWMSRKYLWLKNSSAISLLLRAFSMHTGKIPCLLLIFLCLLVGKLNFILRSFFCFYYDASNLPVIHLLAIQVKLLAQDFNILKASIFDTVK